MADQIVSGLALIISSLLLAFYPSLSIALCFVASVGLYAVLSAFRWKEPRDLSSLKEDIKKQKETIEAITLMLNLGRK